MKLLFDDVTEASKGVWLTTTPPHQIRNMGPAKATRGKRSVLLAEAPYFDPERQLLVLDADHVVVLNVGTTAAAVVIDGWPLIPHEAEDGATQELATHDLGPGDRDFLALAERELQGEPQELAVDVLRAVRKRSAGDLQRGQRNNFSNTPDNFWYVIVQPREQALSITVRGNPDLFRPSSLDLRVDRPGFTRFKVQKASEIHEALRLIFWHQDRQK